MRNGGGRPGDWYVGIANNAHEKLFDHHNLQGADGYICMHADSPQMAGEIRNYFVQVFGTDGDNAAARFDSDTDMVYAYKKGLHTHP
jgi:hypothetical protein